MAIIYEIGISTIREDAKRLQEHALNGAVPARRLAPPTLVLASDVPAPEAEIESVPPAPKKAGKRAPEVNPAPE